MSSLMRPADNEIIGFERIVIVILSSAVASAMVIVLTVCSCRQKHCCIKYGNDDFLLDTFRFVIVIEVTPQCDSDVTG